LSCYNGGDCFIGKIQSCEKVELIGNHRRVTMVETACENNDEHIDSDSDTNGNQTIISSSHTILFRLVIFAKV
jgi:hypothetical protein